MITKSPMCVSVEIVWRYFAVKSRSPFSGSKSLDSHGFQHEGTIVPATKVPLASALLYRRDDSV
jgi:hypothetical protein